MTINNSLLYNIIRISLMNIDMTGSLFLLSLSKLGTEFGFER